MLCDQQLFISVVEVAEGPQLAHRFETEFPFALRGLLASGRKLLKVGSEGDASGQTDRNAASIAVDSTSLQSVIAPVSMYRQRFDQVGAFFQFFAEILTTADDFEKLDRRI